jgi:hypothetical protein
MNNSSKISSRLQIGFVEDSAMLGVNCHIKVTVDIICSIIFL